MKKFLVLVVLMIATVTFGAEEKREAEYLHQGAVHLAAGKYQKAAHAFEQAVRFNPKSAEALQGLGMSYLKLGANDVMVNVNMLEQAAATFTRALAINPNLAEARYNLGIAHLALHNRNDAVKEYDILKGLDKALAQSLAARINEYKPSQSFKLVRESGDRQQSKKKPPENGSVAATSPPKPQTTARFTGTVELYGANWCPHCREAVQYMNEKGIRFTYFNIDEDPAAKSAYEALGAGGIPLIAIGGKKRMNGFGPKSLEYYLNNSL